MPSPTPLKDQDKKLFSKSLNAEDAAILIETIRNGKLIAQAALQLVQLVESRQSSSQKRKLPEKGEKSKSKKKKLG
jgi:hypothetical protein